MLLAAVYYYRMLFMIIIAYGLGLLIIKLKVGTYNLFTINDVEISFCQVKRLYDCITYNQMVLANLGCIYFLNSFFYMINYTDRGRYL